MLNVIKIALDFYIKSSIHVALSVLALAQISMEVAEIENNLPLLIFIFSSAFSAYNFIKFSPSFTTLNFSKLNTLFIVLTIGSLVLSMIVIFLLPRLVLVFALLGSFLVMGYSTPLSYNTSNWRNKKGWKLYLVVFSWVCLTVGVPLASVSVLDLLLFFKLSVLQGIYIYVAILPFEIGDMNFDEPSLQTLPQQFGVLRVKKIGLILLGFGSLLSVFIFEVLSSFVLGTLVAFLILAVLLWRSDENQSPYYARFWVEGIPIVWLGCIYFFYFMLYI